MSRFQDVLRAAVGFRRDEGDDPLVIAAGDESVEGRGRLDMDGDVSDLSLLNDLGELPVSPLNEEALKRPPAAQRFPNGMQPVQYFRPTIVSSGWYRRAGLR